jgi:hypothetical protein
MEFKQLSTVVIAVVVSLAAGFALWGGQSASVGAPNAVPGVNLFPTTQFQQGGGVTTASPVTAAYTVTTDDLQRSNVLTFVASTTMPALTATLPATTSFPLSADAGSYRTWVVENPFTAAATTTTLAAGTGVDLQEPDGQNVVIGINNYAWLTCFRMANSDITCRVDETIPAD